MSNKLRIVLAQLNLTVGDIAGNLQKHLQAAQTAREDLSADVIIFPELSLTGYPPEDLLLRQAFLDQAKDALQTMTDNIKNIYCVVGHPYQTSEGLYNACSLIHNGQVLGRYDKQHLPNYDVFDENRYFKSGNSPCVIPIKGIPMGLLICEDLWFQRPTQQAAALGAKIILSPNASPFEVDKHDSRLTTLKKRAQQNKVAIMYVNLIGGQDELIFDGGSMALDETGQLCQLANFFEECLLPVEIEMTSNKTRMGITTTPLPITEAKIYHALVLSLKDYVNKNHFPDVYVGVSGGIDSALTLAIAVDALGQDRVQALIMPSRHTSNLSMEEASGVTDNLGVKATIVSIEPLYESLLTSLAPLFTHKKPDVTEENIQARCRAIILMAMANKYHSLVLTTGNRSEMAVGYCTLYGDMAGGFAVLKDVPKTMVYALAKYRNTLSPVIPERTIERPPTAELAHDQKDEDSLPPYSVLDKILYAYLNQGLSPEDIIAQGFDHEIVLRIISLVKKNEYKRRQAAIGPHINYTSFGKSWRYPVTNGFDESNPK